MDFKRNIKSLSLGALIFLLGACSSQHPQNHAGERLHKLLLTEKGIQYILENEGNAKLQSLSENTVEQAKQIVNEEITVPIPKDPGGGFTHEQHKKNYVNAVSLSHAYLLTKDEVYLNYTRDLLFAYADLYPELPLHPEAKAQSPGKLFWQVLNEEVALVYFIQAYDAIKPSLKQEEQQKIESGFLLPLVKFIREDSHKTFNKIHNHALWAVAGVGMAGYVLEDSLMVESALYGSDLSGTSGFLRQLDLLFSVDGYYTEGPYYQRYALMPVVVLAQSIQANEPERKIFEYRDSILLKAIGATVELSTCRGTFFPFNDAIPSKSMDTPEMGYALPLAAQMSDHPESWCSLIEGHPHIALTDALIGLPNECVNPYQRKSILIRDGLEGERGGVAILRQPEACSGLTGIMKFGTHGYGHGHFDQLGLVVYFKGMPLLTDYGAARFHNIPQKYGGRYLPENKTWAQQTVAHNTLVVDRKSQFESKTKVADAASSNLLYFKNDGVKTGVGALDTSAYPGVQISRHLWQFSDPNYGSILLDVTSASSASQHEYDLPYHYAQTLVDAKPTTEQNTTELKPFGTSFGYQHLWQKATSEPTRNSMSTLLCIDEFVSFSTAATSEYTVEWVELGANDPNRSLIYQEGWINRCKGKEQTWATLMYAHGSYNPVIESTTGALAPITIQSVEKTDDFITVSYLSDQNLVVLELDLATNDLKIKT